jgi:hypothetical protein
LDVAEEERGATLERACVQERATFAVPLQMTWATVHFRAILPPCITNSCSDAFLHLPQFCISPVQVVSTLFLGACACSVPPFPVLQTDLGGCLGAGWVGAWVLLFWEVLLSAFVPPVLPTSISDHFCRVLCILFLGYLGCF